MDTRKLDLVVGLYDEPVIIDTDSDNRDEVGRIYTTGDDEFDESDRIPFGEELVRRWNAYPEAIARIEAILNELESYGFIGERGADPDNGDTGWKWSPSIVEAKSFLESIKPQNTLDDNGKFIKA